MRTCGHVGVSSGCVRVNVCVCMRLDVCVCMRVRARVHDMESNREGGHGQCVSAQYS